MKCVFLFFLVALATATDAADGCVYNATTYGVGRGYVSPANFTATVNGSTIVIGSGIYNICYKRDNGQYEAEPDFCVTVNGTFVAKDNAAHTAFSYGQVGSLSVQCTSAGDTLKLSVVDSSLTSCTYNGVVYQNTQQFTIGSKGYSCDYGRVSESACVIDGKSYTYYGPFYIGNHTYYCDPTGVTDYGTVLGCQMSNGSYAQWMTDYLDNNKTWKICMYSLGANNTITPQPVLSGCHWENVKDRVDPLDIVMNKNDGVPKKCDYANHTLEMRNLTEAELTAYTNSAAYTAGCPGN